MYDDMVITDFRDRIIFVTIVNHRGNILIGPYCVYHGVLQKSSFT